jgi:hypothetical protein
LTEADVLSREIPLLMGLRYQLTVHTPHTHLRALLLEAVQWYWDDAEAHAAGGSAPAGSPHVVPDGPFLAPSDPACAVEWDTVQERAFRYADIAAATDAGLLFTPAQIAAACVLLATNAVEGAPEPLCQEPPPHAGWYARVYLETKVGAGPSAAVVKMAAAAVAAAGPPPVPAPVRGSIKPVAAPATAPVTGVKTGPAPPPSVTPDVKPAVAVMVREPAQPDTPELLRLGSSTQVQDLLLHVAETIAEAALAPPLSPDEVAALDARLRASMNPSFLPGTKAYEARLEGAKALRREMIAGKAAARAAVAELVARGDAPPGALEFQAAMREGAGGSVATGSDGGGGVDGGSGGDGDLAASVLAAVDEDMGAGSAASAATRRGGPSAAGKRKAAGKR